LKPRAEGGSGLTSRWRIIAERKPPIGWAAQRILQIALALEAAHAEGIAHRDLTPNNIFIVDQGQLRDFVKVLDFGLAKRVETSDDDPDAITATGELIGTPGYMSPEQIEGERGDAMSDVYALGVIWYQLVTVGGAVVVDADHVRVREVGDELRLLLEAPQEVFVAALDELDHHLTAEGLLLGEKHHAHAARAKLADQAIASRQVLSESFSHAAHSRWRVCRSRSRPPMPEIIHSWQEVTQDLRAECKMLPANTCALVGLTRWYGIWRATEP
jgi:hypothetical protein